MPFRYMGTMALAAGIAALPAWSQESTVERGAGSSVALASADDTADLSDTHVGAFRVRIRSLLDKDAFSDLDALAEQTRVQRMRFRGGAWQLNVLYRTLGGTGSLTSTDADWQALIAKLERWAKASPVSPTPRVALAHAYVRFAWKARGNGTAGTVTPEGWVLFRRRVQSARTVLEDAAAIGSRDPQWFREMQTVALAQGWQRSEVDALANQALASEPDYFYFSLAQANYLLPQWYGKAGESESYAEQVADGSGGAQGDAVYFQIAAELNCCRRTQAPGLSWPRVRQGFSALDEHYSSTNRQRNALAYLALRAGDTETARRMFARIGNDWDESVWRTKARFDASRTGRAVGAAMPLPADVVNSHTATANH